MWITASLDSVQVYSCIYSGSLRAVLFVNYFIRWFSDSPSSLCSCFQFRYPCKRLFDVLRLFICLHVYFIDCKCKIDFRRNYVINYNVYSMIVRIGTYNICVGAIAFWLVNISTSFWFVVSDVGTFCHGYIPWCSITLLWSLTSANFHRHSKRPEAWILNEKNHFSMDTGHFIFFIYL